MERSGVPEILPRAPQYWFLLEMRRGKRTETTTGKVLWGAGEGEAQFFLRQLGGRLNKLCLSVLLPLGTFWVTTLETTHLNLHLAELHEASLASVTPNKDWCNQLLFPRVLHRSWWRFSS